MAEVEDEEEIVSAFARACLAEGCLFPVGFMLVTGIATVLGLLFYGGR